MDAEAPSRTAEHMALFRALESARPPGRRLFEDELAQRFLRGRMRSLARAARWGPARWLLCCYIDRRWPGPRLSGVVRTRLIDELVSASLEAGAEQLVLLGAGYDTRASRLQAARAVAVFEVDHPATQARKRALLGRGPANVRYVPVDFERDDLLQALAAAGLERARRSCFLWEGVFSYLSAEAIDETLAAIVRASAQGSTLILTYVDSAALEDAREAGQQWIDAVRRAGEPFRTGLDPSQAQEFFAARGLSLQSDESTAQAALRLGVDGARTMPGFYRLACLQVAAGA